MIKGCLSPIQTTSEQSRLSEWNHLLRGYFFDFVFIWKKAIDTIVPTNRLNQIT
jgi:hypothetical protein